MSVEDCINPACSERFDPVQNHHSCPECGTPFPKDETEGEPDEGEEAEDKPEVACPAPDCDETIPAGKDFCLTCGTERGEQFQEPDEPEPPEGPTCPNGHSVSADDQYCPTCGAEVEAPSEPPEPPEPELTCPNGHTVTGDAQFCPECGAEIEEPGETGDRPEPTGPSVTLEIEGNEYPVVEDGVVDTAPDDDEPGRDDTFGAKARVAAVRSGVEKDDALLIHREYLRFRVDDGDCYVENVGGSEDTGSNPTRFNGEEFPRGEERQLSDGDAIELAGVVTATVRVE